MFLDISNQGLTSFEGINLNGVTVLHCFCNEITSFEHLPNSITELDCGNNRIRSFKYLPNSIIELLCDRNQIRSFKYLPNSITKLTCYNNQITSFEHLPNSIKILDCRWNQITSFKYLPKSITKLDCRNNPIENEYQNTDLKKIHLKNTIKTYQDGIFKINNILFDRNTKIIQHVWNKYWYDTYNEKDENRYFNSVKKREGYLIN